MKPRLLMIGRTRYRLPASPSLHRKFAALEQRFDVRMVARAEPGSPTDEGALHLLAALPSRRLDSLLFYLRLPWRIFREDRRFRPDAIVAQGPYEAAAALLARPQAKVVVEIHGDWHTATRLYGSRLRRLLSPLADRVADEAIKHADGVRTLSPYTTGLVRELGVEPDGEFPAFMDLAAFCGRPPDPLPEQPRILFVGVLERYKNVDSLAKTWRFVARVVPGAELTVVGSGSRASVIEQLVHGYPGRVTWKQRLSPEQVAAELDAATLLVLPSHSEGLPRIVVEAFCRGRPVVGSRGGGIPDIVEHGRNGLLADPSRLGRQLVRALSDETLVQRLARGARESSEQWRASPDDFAERMEALIHAVH